MKFSEFTHLVETEEEVLESFYIRFFGTGCFEDAGIGLYEFWGSKGNDVNYIPVIPEILWDNKKYTDAQNTIIKNYLETNRESIESSLLEKFYDIYKEL